MYKKPTRIFALLLCLFLLTGLPAVPAFAVGDDEPAESPAEDASLVKDLDPAALGVHKLGEISGDETPPDLSDLTPDTSLKQLVRVSVFLTEPSAVDAGYAAQGIGHDRSAAGYRTALRNRQKSVQAAIESRLGYPLDVVWNLTLLTDAFSAWVYGKDIPVIERMDGVAAVQRENRYTVPGAGGGQPETANTSAGMVGASEAWASGYTGAGTRIAVIDTGIDTEHISFAADAFDYAIAAYERQSGRTVDLMKASDIPSSLNGAGTYLSSKIPYAYNYVDKDLTVDHLSDRQGEHGSHVAGIAAANRYVKQGGSFADAANTVHAVGMAPDAQLLVMKVFGADGGAYDSDYFAAIEDAVAMDADAVNLSLGSAAPGFTYDNAYQEVLNGLAGGASGAGAVLAVSAGNSGSYLSHNSNIHDLYIEDVSLHTGGSPGTFINSMCVASADNTGRTGVPLVFNGSRDVFITDHVSGGGSFFDLSGTYDYVYIDSTGTFNDYISVNLAAGDLRGKIVIVNRGYIDFAAKGNNAAEFAPAGLIVANNETGALHMDLDAYTGTFPMASMTQADADALKASSAGDYANGRHFYTGTVTVTHSTVHYVTADRTEAEMSYFSSWGVPGSLLMKPEITAPGGDIYSVFGTSYSPKGVRQGGTDQYEILSGTSMAAPHIAGLSALTAQYLKETDYAARNPGLAGWSRRAVIQSLLMSTATPMVDADGCYYSVLQQGSGLADVSRAVSASSVVMMKDAGLTTATGAAADGKVKAELGDDPDRSGVYEYSFTVYNLADRDLTYRLKTDLFTQAAASDYAASYLLPGTADLSAKVTYAFVQELDEPHDVDRNGVTNEDDAQAVLDVLSGERDGSGFDLSAGEIDGDGRLSTRDAYLLLQIGERAAGALTVKAGSARDVTVKIVLADESREYLEDNYPSGAYIEGFTYVECTDVTAEGAVCADTHSIPLLGFYGSWTDPSMFEGRSYPDNWYNGIYGHWKNRRSYFEDVEANYMTLKYGSRLCYFMGNPYMVEHDGFPGEVLAVNSGDRIVSLSSGLIRSAGAAGFAVLKTDGHGGVTEVLELSDVRRNVSGLYYDVGTGSWANNRADLHSVGRTAASYGLKEGDTFRIGSCAVPEYYAMQVHSGDMTAADAGTLTDGEFTALLKAGVLGRGAFFGYDFTVDDTAPEITGIERDGNNVRVTASDNQNLAYVALLSPDGQTVYASTAPRAAEYSGTLESILDLDTEEGYVAVFAADYAGNETAKALRTDGGQAADPHAVSAVAVAPDTLDLYTGNETDISASVTPVTAEDRNVTWSSSNRSVATVDGTGHVTAVGAGRATITATSVSDRTRSGSCTVRVISIDKPLNGIVWDEDGGVFFSSFNPKDLSSWKKGHAESAAFPVQSALVSDTRKLYAATFDPEAGTSMLYRVDPDTYAMEEYAENYVGATDFALAATGCADTGMVYTCLSYLVAGPLSPQDDGSGTEYTGVPYAVLDMANTDQKTALAAVATKERSTYGGTFYLLDEHGTILETTLGADPDYVPGFGSRFAFSVPEVVMETYIPTDVLYQDLYFDGTWLYWSHYADGVSTLYAIDVDSGTVYDTGNFGDGVWPVTGLYVKGQAAPASYGGAEAAAVSYGPLELRREDLMTAEVRTRLAAAASKAPAGGLNAVRVSEAPFVRGETDAPSAVRSSQYTDDQDTVVITLSDDEAVTNGLMTISFPEGLSYVRTSSPAYCSAHADAEAGTVTIAYAAAAPIPAKETIARLVFALGEPDRVQEVTVAVTERNRDTDVSEPPVTIRTGKPVFRSQALVLSGEIAVKFNMELPPIDGVDYSSSFMDFNVGSSPDVTVRTSEAALDSSGRYGFLAYVKSIQMADPIHANFCYLDAAFPQSFRIVYKRYSVERYIQAMDERQDQFDAETMALVHAIADYGHYAQLYLSEVNGWTIGTDYAAMDTFYTSSYDYADILSKVTPKAFAKAISGSNVTKATYKLHLDAETTVDVYLTTKDGSAPTNVKLSVLEELSGKTVTKDVVPELQSDGRYLIRIPGISAHKLGDIYTITGTAGRTFRVQVSALSYVRSVLNNAGSTRAAKDGMASLYAYYAATMAYRQKSST